jgi:hypothetical protein
MQGKRDKLYLYVEPTLRIDHYFQILASRL